MKKRVYLLTIILLIAVMVPALAMAQVHNGAAPAANNYGTSACTLSQNYALGELLSYVSCLIGTGVIPLLFALAVAMFVWGIVQYVINTTNEEKRQKGRQLMIWGIIALTVMISVWGLVRVVGNTFNLPTSTLPQVKP